MVRRRAVTVETIWHEGGPVAKIPTRYASALAVVANPFAGRYEPDLLGLQSALRRLGYELAQRARRLCSAPTRCRSTARAHWSG